MFPMGFFCHSNEHTGQQRILDTTSHHLIVYARAEEKDGDLEESVQTFRIFRTTLRTNIGHMTSQLNRLSRWSKEQKLIYGSVSWRQEPTSFFFFFFRPSVGASLHGRLVGLQVGHQVLTHPFNPRRCRIHLYCGFIYTVIWRS